MSPDTVYIDMYKEALEFDLWMFFWATPRQLPLASWPWRVDDFSGKKDGLQMVIFHSYVSHYQRVNQRFYEMWMC